MATPICEPECPHETAHECVMDWFGHYMALSAKELAAVYATNKSRANHDVPIEMEMAMQERRQEIGKKLVAGEL